MKMNIYTIYDTAAKTYMRPFFMASDGQALRAFTDISTDADHEVGKHPEDYSLHRIGTFDDQKAAINPETPDCLATALEVVAASRNVEKGKLRQFDMDISANPGGTN